MKIGIIFGGQSREREISFAGGRTVYDNLDKNIFEAIPIFADSFGNFVLLNWQYIYKGSIRDFYPPVDAIPASPGEFQVYAEALGDLSAEEQQQIIGKIGRKINVEELAASIDFAFLCLHGPYGEDGTIQGLFDFYHIPYSGSGIFSSAFGVNKAIQKRLMVDACFNSPPFITIKRKDYISGNCKGIFGRAKEEIGFPMVIKPANQGSSIGITILQEDVDEFAFMSAVEKALFTRWADAGEWKAMDSHQKNRYVRELTDIREGIGLPIRSGDDVLYHPDKLLEYLEQHLSKEEGLVLEALDGESEILIEGFIEGKEFSCIVLQKEDNSPVALPPTEIRKGKELFDYRSKYLPGLSRKITPINLPAEQIQQIRRECERLFSAFDFNVYARIDGFINSEGKIFLNDPNTTSGMLPSSFFFHQAAEIGLNPSQFLTYIVHTSLSQRAQSGGRNLRYRPLLEQLNSAIAKAGEAQDEKTRIAVILGGYSSERHISVESGRNIFEKLASSKKYEAIPVFLTGSDDAHELYLIPVNILLKDNADDIREKVFDFHQHPVLQEIISECSEITTKYAGKNALFEPRKISFKKLASLADGVFIALHGRPGEDGALQRELEQVGLPYNGSSADSSNITINKFVTNELLRQHGFKVANHTVFTKNEWQKQQSSLERIFNDFEVPFIAKPVDDGCSSAVKKIKSEKEFKAFVELLFRDEEELLKEQVSILKIKPKEEIPRKKEILVEELIDASGAVQFMEITCGLLTHRNETGELIYEVFEPSEVLAEDEILSLEEKFLAGQGQNITPARLGNSPVEYEKIVAQVKDDLERAARVLGVSGYCRIDAFVRVFENLKTETIIIEVNSLPGMTPATCIFHQTAINGYSPYDFIDKILQFGFGEKEKVAS